MDPDITNNNNEMDPVLKTISLHCFFCCSLPNYLFIYVVGAVFLPCGHLISCVNCSPKIKDCPFCRQFIKGKVGSFPL